MAIELSKRLQDYLNEHEGETLAIADIADTDIRLLVEMVTVASDIPEQPDGKKQTSGFESFFHTDKNYGGACYELDRRGYELFKYWRQKGLPLPHDAVLYEGETKSEPVDCGSSVQLDVKGIATEIMFDDEARKPMRVYMDAYPETQEKLKELAKKFPRGLRGRAFAKLLEMAVDNLYEEASK